MPLPETIDARPIMGGEQPLPEGFDPLWEFQQVVRVSERTYPVQVSVLLASARAFLPPGTRFVVMVSEPEGMFGRTEVLGWQYDLSWSLEDPWVPDVAVPASLAEARRQRVIRLVA